MMLNIKRPQGARMIAPLELFPWMELDAPAEPSPEEIASNVLATFAAMRQPDER